MKFHTSSNCRTAQAALIAMIEGSPLSDRILLLAYGYLRDPADVALAVSEWMAKDSDRRTFLIVGLFGKRERLSEYAEARSKTSPSIEPDDKDLEKLVADCASFAEKFPLLLNEPRLGLRVLPAPNFHAKVAALLACVESAPGLDTIGDMEDLVPAEVFFGSTNFTEKGFKENIEFDAHIERADQEDLDAIVEPLKELIAIAVRESKRDPTCQKALGMIEAQIEIIEHGKRREQCLQQESTHTAIHRDAMAEQFRKDNE